MKVARLFLYLMTATAMASAQSPTDSTTSPSRSPRTTLEITSLPPGAAVQLDTQSIGTTPLSLEGIPYGSHVIRIQLDGHAAFVDTVLLKFGSIYRASPRLSRTGSVRIFSEPPGVRAYLADTLIGFTPIDMSGFNPGRVSVRIEDPVYKPFRSYIFIPESDTAKVSAVLERRYVSLTATAHDPSALILVDGLEIGKGSIVDHPMESGVRRISFEDAITRQRASTIVHSRSEPVHVRSLSGVLQLSPLFASMAFPGAGQYLDGAKAKGGTISAGFVALAGVSFVLNHSVSKRLDDYEVARKKYLDYAGSSAAELITLRKEAQARHDRAMTAWRWNLVPIAGAVAVYVYSLVDVLLHHTRGLDIEIAAPPPAVGQAVDLQATVRLTIGS